VSKVYASVPPLLRSCAAAFSVWRGNGLPVAMSSGEEVVYATQRMKTNLKQEGKDSQKMTSGAAANPQCDDEPGDKRPLAKRR